MSSGRWRGEAAIGGLLVVLVLVLVVGGGALRFFMARRPVYENADAVPSTAAAAPAGRYADPAEEARRLARDLAARDNVAGLSVAVAVNGDIVWAEGFGWADVENRTPVTPATRFRLGALSKPLTAVGAALLHDRGRLDLDAPIQRYVPKYPKKQWTLTTRQLLSDVGGVHRIRGDNNDAMPVEHCAHLGEAVGLLKDDPLLFEPGSQYRYSVWGWILVSAVIEGAAGEPFDSYMIRQVFEPLGMKSTVLEEKEGLDDVAQIGGRPDYSCLAGAGAFLSTPTDLVRLGSATLKPGFLKADTMAAMQTPARLSSGATTTYGLGWTVRSVQLANHTARVVSHRGSPAGGSVSLLTFPDHGIAVAVAANVADAKGVDPFALQIADLFTRRQNR